jgi:hypothetical protein
LNTDLVQNRHVRFPRQALPKPRVAYRIVHESSQFNDGILGVALFPNVAHVLDDTWPILLFPVAVAATCTPILVPVVLRPLWVGLAFISSPFVISVHLDTSLDWIEGKCSDRMRY